MNNDDWEKRFYDLLAKDLIDVPEDYYDEKILFSEPEQLMEIFHNIEERNLEIIKKSQENEKGHSWVWISSLGIFGTSMTMVDHT